MAENLLLAFLLAFLLLFALFLRNWAKSVRDEKAVWEAESARWDADRIEREALETARAMDLPPPGREGLLILDHLIRRLRATGEFDPVRTALGLGAYAAMSLKQWREGSYLHVANRIHVTWEREGETCTLDVLLFVYLKLKSVIHNSFERLTDKIEYGRPLPL
ncbi:MAG: hypothetical protein AAB229_07785 [Candidatus Hydrogenedentota bacterium]